MLKCLRLESRVPLEISHVPQVGNRWSRGSDVDVRLEKSTINISLMTSQKNPSLPHCQTTVSSVNLFRTLARLTIYLVISENAIMLHQLLRDSPLMNNNKKKTYLERRQKGRKWLQTRKADKIMKAIFF